ncbi:PREDICTED: tabersonine 16-O-methyltransferase-like [Nicotiana attenuata]|uniref:tabersonine 16-O-methyltransferase-like n=1 Tax=Nicotiana attenuata TaxID=49451 RepID=UPI0009052673|nr:PREDICTED: tabersonine 16-O-methyltransferase-like [Nicotiana attenuata]
MCALQLGIPDVLYKYGKPMSLSDLSAELSLVINPSKVCFLNQHDQDHHYSLTPASRLLLDNEPFNVRSLLLINHDPVFSKAWFESKMILPLLFILLMGNLYGIIFHVDQEPRVLGDIFNDALASDSRLNTNFLITECKHVFEGLSSLVVALCTVHVVEDCKGSGNLEFVGRDMFDNIPHANAILLKCILHDWRDEDCVKIY